MTLGEGCDKTLPQLFLDLLSRKVGGDGGGGFVTADTDGDGSFDYVEEIPFGAANATVEVPNRVKGNGYVTFRTAGGWPFKATNVCGQVTTKKINLLDLLPIGMIPIVGPPIAFALAAQCEASLVFSASDDVQVPILDIFPPEIVNCQESGYEFFTNVGCDIPVEWSIPVANEDCAGDALTYKGITTNVDLSNYNGPAIPAVPSIQESGVYQTQGPAPGSILPPGTYPVTYTVASCNGNLVLVLLMSE